jgi:hypothetical protein
MVENDRDRAIRLVRHGYQVAVGMQTVDLDSINRARPADLRYGTRAELVREFWNAAGAVATFAVQMQLISPSDAEEILRSYSTLLPPT